jgi:hypothetical protein
MAGGRSKGQNLIARCTPEPSGSGAAM